MRGLHLHGAGIAALVGIRQVVVDLAIGDDDAALDLTVAQAGQHDFLANLLAKLGPGDAVLFQCSTELRQAEAVAFGNAAHRGVEFDVGDAQAGFPGELHLHAIGDHAFEQLFFEHLARR